MSNNSSNRVVRTLGVPAMALVLASSSMIALAGAAAAAPPAPSILWVNPVCERDSSNYYTVYPGVQVSYKGKWVSFYVNASVTGARDSDFTVPRWDSSMTYTEPRRPVGAGTGDATIEVSVRDNKGNVKLTSKKTVSCPTVS